jgi:hypothetical protein
MTAPTYAPTPVLDIVSFGYRKFFNHLLPLTKIASPFLLFASLVIGFVYPEQLRIQRITEPGLADIIPILTMYGMLLVATGVMQYSLYAGIQYVRDVYYDEVNPSLASYMIPKMSLFGVFSIFSLYMVSFIFAVIITFIGFLLLILPGLAMLVGIFYATNRLALVWVSYFNDPKLGVMHAFRQSWALTENNFWRTVGLCFVTTVIQTIISLPFNLIDFIIGLISGFNPSFVANPLFPFMYSVLMAVSYWAQFVLGVGGMMFVFFRFFFDLQSRKNPELMPATEPVKNNYWSPPEPEQPMD